MEIAWLVLLVVGRVVSSGWANVLQKREVERSQDPWGVVCSSLVVVALCLTPWVVTTFWNTAPWSTLPSSFWIACCTAALLDVPGNVLLVGSLGKSDLSLVGPLNSLKPVVGMLLGLWLLNEQPTFLGLVGVAVLALGTWGLASTSDMGTSDPGTSKTRQEKRGGWRWLIGSAARWRFGALFLTAAASIYLKKGIEIAGPWTTFAIWSWCCVAIAIPWRFIQIFWPRIMPRRSTQAPPSPQSTSPRQPIAWFSKEIWGLGLLFLTLQGLSILLFDLMPVSYALALFQLGGLMNVYLGHRLFGEKGGWKRAFLCLVMIAGATLILIG